MPWKVVKDETACSASKPWAVKVEATGETVGCHETKAKALAQLAALNANAKTGAPMQQTRAYHASNIRATPDGSRTFEALVVVYGIIDDYGTIFDPGCFTDSLHERMPRITWAHSWSEPLGRYVDFRDDDQGLVLIGEFDDFDAVPRARQAYAQLLSGTIDQFSVGFHSIDRYEEDGVEHFRKVGLDEAALVLVGAVPGTKLLSVRSGIGVREVPEDLVISLAKKVAASELTQAEAKAAIDLAAGETAGSGDGDVPPLVAPPEPDPASVALDAEAADALETLGIG